ncbi:PAS domain-containing protein [Salegentibacter sp. HM20]
MIQSFQLREIFDAFPENCLLLDAKVPGYPILRVNKKYQKTTGISKEDLLGKKIFEAFPGNPGKEEKFQQLLSNSILSAISNLESHKIEKLRYDLPDNETGELKKRFWEVNNIAIKDEAGTLSYILHLVKDITTKVILRQKEKKSIKKLQVSKIRLKESQEVALIGSWELNLIEEKLYWSDMVRKIHEVAEDFEPDLNSAINFYKTDEDKKTVANAVNNAIELEQPFDIELQIITAKNKEKWVRATGRSEFKNGVCHRVFGATQDITSRKLAEERLENVNNNIPGVVFRYKKYPDGSDKLMYLSNGSLEMWGISAEEASRDNSKIWDLYHPEDLEDHKKSIDKSFRTLSIWKHEWRIFHPTKDLRWNRGSGTPHRMVDGSVIWDSIITDVTEEKLKQQEKEEIERALMSSREQYENLVESIDGIFWEAKADTVQFTFVSPQSIDILGYTPDEWYSSPKFWPDHIHPEDKDFAIGFCSNEVKMGRNHQFEYRMISKEGRSVWLNDIVSVVKREGKPPLLRGFMTDITRRKEAEIDLQKSRGRLENIMEQSLDVISIIDAEGKFLEIGASSKRLFGYTPEELKGRQFIDFVFKEDAQITLEVAASIMNGKPVTNFENRYVTKCGEVVSVIWSARWVEEDQLMYAIARDAREIKEAKKQLQLSEMRFKGLVQEGADLIALLDKNGDYIYASPSSITQLGFDPQDLKGNNAFDFIHPDDTPKATKALTQIFEEKRVEIEAFRFRHKAGGWRWLETILTNRLDDPAINGIVANSRDITEKKYFRDLEKLEKQIFELHFQKSRDLKSIIKFYLEEIEKIMPGMHCSLQNFKNAALFSWVNTQESNYLKFLENGLKPGKSLASFDRAVEEKKEVIIEDLSKLPASCIKEQLLKQGFFSGWSYPVMNASGEMLAVFTVNHKSARKPSYFEENIVIRAVKILQVIIESHLKERELKLHNERFNYVTKATSDAIWDWDLVKMKIYWGQGFEELFGYPIQSLSTDISSWTDHIHPEDTERAYQSILECIDGNKLNWEEEYRYLHANGNYRYVKDRGFVVRDENGKALRMVGAMLDVTESKIYEVSLKKLNDHLVKQAKELAVSNAELEQFAYVASHDLQEPLRMVTSFLTQLENKYSEKLDDKGRRYIHFAVDGAKRMREIILDLLDYSRVGREEDKLETINLEELIGEIKHLYYKQIQEKSARISTRNLPEIKAPRASTRQIFQNLIGNALKYSKEEAPPKITIECEDQEDMWVFKIKDNGIGISQDYFERIFVIFQRLHNREQYSGTGMGLAITKKIIENLGGKIWLTSKEGKGSTFYFSLPISRVEEQKI